ncbi:MAG: hypothetical protein KF852_18230 [Saprospiraceae bacterium]|nr:hypothetical protein [Saprospiraceae bacterium]
MRYLIGPELLWLLIYGGADLLAKANTPPTKRVDDFIENIWFWIPLLALFTFALWWVPVVEKRWLLLRVWAACVVGCHYSLEKAIGASSTQGPGAGMAWLVGMMLLFLFLIVGSVVVKIKF